MSVVDCGGLSWNGSHGSSVWRVVWVVVVEVGMTAMEAPFGEWCGLW